MPSLLCWFSAAKTLSLWDSEWQSLWPVSISWILQKRAIVSTCFLSPAPAAPGTPSLLHHPHRERRSQHTTGMCPSCFHFPPFYYSSALLFSNALFSSPPQGVFLFHTSASLSRFVGFCVSICVCIRPMPVALWASDSGLCPLWVHSFLWMCVYMWLSPLCDPLPESLIPSLALYHPWGIGASLAHDHHHPLI